MEKRHLYLLWTSESKLTAEKMVFMYAINAMVKGWWEAVTLIVWGAPARLVAEDREIREKVREAMAAGVHVTACKACTDQLGVTARFEALGIEVIYWGAPLTAVLKEGECLLTV